MRRQIFGGDSEITGTVTKHIEGPNRQTFSVEESPHQEAANKQHHRQPQQYHQQQPTAKGRRRGRTTTRPTTATTATLPICSSHLIRFPARFSTLKSCRLFSPSISRIELECRSRTSSLRREPRFDICHPRDRVVKMFIVVGNILCCYRYFLIFFMVAKWLIVVAAVALLLLSVFLWQWFLSS